MVRAIQKRSTLIASLYSSLNSLRPSRNGNTINSGLHSLHTPFGCFAHLMHLLHVFIVSSWMGEGWSLWNPKRVSTYISRRWICSCPLLCRTSSGWSRRMLKVYLKNKKSKTEKNKACKSRYLRTWIIVFGPNHLPTATPSVTPMLA